MSFETTTTIICDKCGRNGPTLDGLSVSFERVRDVAFKRGWTRGYNNWETMDTDLCQDCSDSSAPRQRGGK